MALSDVQQDTPSDTPAAISPEVREMIAARAFEDWPAEKVLTWAIESFHPRLALSASFGAPEGMLLLDMMHEIEPTSRIFMLDTGRLHQASYDLVDRIRDRYGKPIEIVFPRAEDVEEMVREKGLNFFYESLEDRKRCCFVRKVAPMRRYLQDLDGYVSGLRREQNASRAETPRVTMDTANGGRVKINPLADWTSEQVWDAVKRREVPVNRLHKTGYPSVGCAPCTRAIREGDDPRAGRWWWETDLTKECGLHLDPGAGI
jgi:thioredoxin-dependent adenylylsulfate APS reductase